MEFYKTLESILLAETPAKKTGLFLEFYEKLGQGKIVRDVFSPIRVFTSPSYRDFCVVVDQKLTARRPKLGGERGQIQMLHSVAHIEYSAIDLALDAVYRFRDNGGEFDSDWIEVAYDEVCHFLMIEELLKEFGSHYGEFPVQDALFEASVLTQDFVERMAVVPRYLEANGLDATPLILDKLSSLKSTPMIEKITEALKTILDEEIDHVCKGDKWFKVACERKNLHPDVYFEIIEKYYPSCFPRKVEINCDARKSAGFLCSELERISHIKC